MSKIFKLFNLLHIMTYKLKHIKTLSIPLRMRKWEKNILFEIEPRGKVTIGRYAWIRRNVQFWCSDDAKINIGEFVFFNTGDIISARGNISIGNNTIMGPNVMIYDHNHDYRNSNSGFSVGSITIGENVWIGANCCILKGVTIGDNSVIGAGTVVSKNIPANSIATSQNNLIIKPILKGEEK